MYVYWPLRLCECISLTGSCAVSVLMNHLYMYFHLWQTQLPHTPHCCSTVFVIMMPAVQLIVSLLVHVLPGNPLPSAVSLEIA
jgi:hypothetical protein